MSDVKLPKGLSPAQALSVVSHIAEAEHIEFAWSRTTAALRHFGFERVNYVFTRYKVGKSIGDPNNVLFLSTHSLERVKEHHVSGLYLRTPEYRWIRENIGACSWGWARKQREAGLLSEDECAVMDQLKTARRRAGYSISFAEASMRSKGAMGLASLPGVSQDELDDYWQIHSGAIMAICNMAHSRLTQLPQPGPVVGLTSRQREMLDWVADGKTTQDICVLTGLSASTVEKHLRLARDTLAVETTAQAVVKLSYLNQLFVSGGMAGR